MQVSVVSWVLVCPAHQETRSKMDSECAQATIDAAGKGVRSVVFRLPQYVWGHGGSFFIPHQLDTARKLRKAYYLLPGGLS